MAHLIKVTVKDTELRLRTAPGLFSPEAADKGTLAMLSLVAFAPEDKVLDLGCGYGLVGVLAAKLIGPERVFLLDKDHAAVTMASENLKFNGVGSTQVIHSDGFHHFTETGFTKILSNPPYHADFSVPKHFIEKGFNRLLVGGRMFMVTMRETWYRKKFESVFGGVRVHRSDQYVIFEAMKKSSQYARKTQVVKRELAH